MRSGIDPRAARWIAIRIALLGVALACGLGGIAARAVYLQVLRRERLGQEAVKQFVREIELRPRRGTITDRSGLPLAADAAAASIFVDPFELERKLPEPGRAEQAWKGLGRALGLDPRALSRKAGKGGRFAWVKRRISPAEADAVAGLGIPGVGVVKESRRYYPRRELGGQVLGLVGDDGNGLEGIELAYDELLRGEPARIRALRDAKGRRVLRDVPESDRVREGARVELTLDQGLQLVAETALSRAVAQARAAGGMAVAIDPRTGEVLALANAPLFNPNAPRRMEDVRNRAVLDLFEPGSTFKVFSIGGALEEKALRAQDALFCENGAWHIGPKVIHDHKPLAWVGPSRILITSSNIGAGKIAHKLGRERLVATLLSFGFGEPTGIGVSGEPKGQVPTPRGEHQLATMSFGQSVTATPLQITAAFAAVANGGTLLTPHLVRRVVDTADGEILEQAEPAPVRRVLSRETAALLSRWMEGVVSDPEGTGKRARIEGLRVAGKTGTAQKVDPVSRTYSQDKRFSSFVGFAPAEAPQVVVGVFIDEPKGDIYGGEIAAPVFREVAEYALESMGGRSDRLALGQPHPAPTLASPPHEQADEHDDTGDATPERIASASTQAGSRSTVAVPALDGLSARAALRALEEADLVGEVAGSGRVASQAPPPGEVVARGSRIRLTLVPPG